MDAKRDFIVGLTALIGIAGLGALLIMFGELSWARGDRYELTLVMPNAKGATRSGFITLNGVEVGRVREMRTGGDPRRGVELVLAIDAGVRVPRDVTVAIERDFLGASRVALNTEYLGAGAPAPGPDDYFQPGDSFQRTAQGMLEQLAGMIDRRFESLMGAAESFERLSDTYVRVGESIEKLVDPSHPDAGEGQSVNIPAMLTRLDGAIAAARDWLEDEELKSDAKATMERARSTLDKLAEAVDAWSDVAATLDESATKLSADFDDGLREFVRATGSLNEALEEIRAVAERVAEGEGTLGQLVNNPDLYRSLNDAAQRLETSLREAQLLIEKFRKEGVPVQF